MRRLSHWFGGLPRSEKGLYIGMILVSIAVLPCYVLGMATVVNDRTRQATPTPTVLRIFPTMTPSVTRTATPVVPTATTTRTSTPVPPTETLEPTPTQFVPPTPEPTVPVTGTVTVAGTVTPGQRGATPPVPPAPGATKVP
jgi:hypothetical protein